jgi:hypothetical protein
MSLLAPLYFFGALAVGLPILFHLIRRHPRGEIEFSSLMFLRPSPPRLTRRSRLDNWLLLLIRALVLTLLAAAFARPFLRSVASLEAELPGRRLVLLIDTSASLQRAGLWQQSLDKARDVIADLQPADRLAIVSFDREPKTLLGFEQSSQLTPAQLKTTAGNLLRDLSPSWQRTELGRAISYAADLALAYEPEDDTEAGLERADDSARVSASGPAQMVLITDMQSGGHMESLQSYAWPKDLRLDVRQVTTTAKTNASAQILVATPELEADQRRVRVRVANSADASESRFSIGWSGDELSAGSAMELPVQVPPGQSRVVRLPIPTPGTTSLLLRGDDHSFDNVRYIVSPQPISMSLLYLGDVVADPRDNPFHYLQLVPLSNQRRTVSVEAISEDKLVEVPDPKQVPLILLAKSVSQPVATRLRDYVESGGRLLVLFADQKGSDSLAENLNQIASSELAVNEADVDDYVMLSRIDFAHPVFETMADPQFNDFSKIRFWSHRKITNLADGWEVIVDFEDGDPALVEQEMGEGRLLVLTAGWQPEASQLALSSKFIPLVFSLFQPNQRSTAADRYTVGEPIDFLPSETATITTPAKTAFDFQSPDDLDGIDQPGVYQYTDGEVSRSFAVNLDDAESRTDPLDEDEFERLGVILGKNLTAEQAIADQRQLRDRELERQQKIWQWLLVAALGLLAVEIWLAAKWSRRRGDDVSELAEV